MADRDFEMKAARIANMAARATVNRMRNEGIGLTIEEAAQVAVARSSGVEVYCRGCGHEMTSDEAASSRCGLCGSRQATTNPVYRCANPRCMAPVSVKQEACLKCGSREAVKANGKPLVTIRNPQPYHTCENCLKPVAISQPQCNSCGCTRAVRTVER